MANPGTEYTGKRENLFIEDLPSEFLVTFTSDESNPSAGNNFRLDWSCQLWAQNSIESCFFSIKILYLEVFFKPGSNIPKTLGSSK